MAGMTEAQILAQNQAYIDAYNQSQVPTTTVGVGGGGVAYELVNGTWTVVTDPGLAGQITSQFGKGQTGTLQPTSTPTPAPTPVPTTTLGGVPQEGETKTVLGVTYVYRNGQWVVTGTIVPPTSTGTTTTTGTNLNPATGKEAYGPYTQYLAGLGLGRGYQSPSQTYLANLYDSLRSIWSLESGINRALQTGTPNWGDYFGNVAGGAQSIYARGADVLSRLMGMTGEQRQLGQLNYEPTYNELGQAAYPAGANLADLQALMSIGQAGKYNPLGAAWGASRVPYLQEQWALGRASGTEANTFLDYLRVKLGL